MSSQQHIVIIGAGIIGVCCAVALQRHGFHVTLIDQQGIGQGCSKGNAGHFATEQVFPLADKSLLPQLPSMLLDPLGPFRIDWAYLLKALPWFCRFLWNMSQHRFKQNTTAISALNREALSAYDDLLAYTGLCKLLQKKGSLLTFEHNKSARIRSLQARFLALDVGVDYLNQNELLKLEPSLSQRVKGALFFTDVGHTSNPELLCHALGQSALGKGAAFRQTQVACITPKTTGYEVNTLQGTINCDGVVVASGAWSKTLISPLGYNVPLDTERGYHLMLPDQHVLTRPVASAERKFIMTPMEQGLRLAGTVEFAGLNAPMNERRADILLPHAKQLLSPIKANQHDKSHNNEGLRWMGFRPSLPDSLPVIGQAPRHPGLYFAFGHQHLGLTWGAITGKLIGQIVAGLDTSLDITPYCISRFN